MRMKMLRWLLARMGDWVGRLAGEERLGDSFWTNSGVHSEFIGLGIGLRSRLGIVYFCLKQCFALSIPQVGHYVIEKSCEIWVAGRKL